jgi:hypothetical protein
MADNLISGVAGNEKNDGNDRRYFGVRLGASFRMSED